MTAIELLNNYSEWEGAKVLQLLVKHPDTCIYATVVELCLENSVPPLEAQNLRYHLAPIKMTDEPTLKAVKKRLNQLIAIVGADPCVCPTKGKHGGLPLQDTPLKDFTAAYNAWCKENNFRSSNARTLASELRAEGYDVVFGAHNVTIIKGLGLIDARL
ncbi:MAG: hypothetical protein CVU50_10500 [Candidatus Cloacimonetes bacterium HGW-Cloacimonetes-3]|jgi:hypothetical protein|nr:MAG: hypothetical protein CVU50_10500 [Candidatus Cloacimonetes bacterium HGW-Cloacimonetes-3]